MKNLINIFRITKGYKKKKRENESLVLPLPFMIYYRKLFLKEKPFQFIKWKRYKLSLDTIHKIDNIFPFSLFSIINYK